MVQAKIDKDEKVIEISRKVADVNPSIPLSDNYERMISGMLYDAMTEPLVKARYESNRLTYKFNNLIGTTNSPEEHEKESQKILGSLLGKSGKDCWIESLQVDYGFNTFIGDRFYANFNLILLDCSIIVIGDRVMCGPNVSLLTATHQTDIQSRRDDIEYALPIYIGDDCWIGAGVTILGGVTVGKGCTIGAGAVVAKDIPDFSIAVGVPAKVVGRVEPVD